MTNTIQEQIKILKTLVNRGNKIINSHVYNNKQEVELIMQTIAYSESFLTEGLAKNILPKNDKTYEMAKDVTMFLMLALLDNFNQISALVKSYLDKDNIQLKIKSRNNISYIEAKIANSDFIYNEIFIKDNPILYNMISTYITNTIPKMNTYLQNCIIDKYQELIKLADTQINSILNKNTSLNSKRLALLNYRKKLKEVGVNIKIPKMNSTDRKCDFKKNYAKKKVKLNHNIFISIK